MPIVDIGTQRFTVVTHDDPPGTSGACHTYRVEEAHKDPATLVPHTFATVYFQDGPIQEVGVNGCHHEDLLAILIHRLQGFQSGAYACIENANALTHLELALQALAVRTSKREARGVEGTSTA